MRKPYIENDFVYKNYKCSVIFQTLCHRCGYVGIPKGHSLYGLDYDEIPVICHGGLTYMYPDLVGHEEESDIFWIGFDCAHFGDGKDYDAGRRYFADDPDHIDMLNRWEDLDNRYPCDDEVRTQEYVEEQCRYIVDQLIEYDRPWNKFKRWLLQFFRRVFVWKN